MDPTWNMASLNFNHLPDQHPPTAATYFALTQGLVPSSDKIVYGNCWNSLHSSFYFHELWILGVFVVYGASWYFVVQVQFHRDLQFLRKTGNVALSFELQFRHC